MKPIHHQGLRKGEHRAAKKKKMKKSNRQDSLNVTTMVVAVAAVPKSY
jgi:hypothetical protein